MTECSVFNTASANTGMPAGLPVRTPLDSDVLDLQGLCDRCMGNLNLVERVLDKFEQHLPGELAELEQVLELGDAARIAQVAHRIKGNSSSVSAAGLQRAAAAIEDLSRAGRVADVPARLPSLYEQWRRYVDCRATLRPAAADAAVPRAAPTFCASMTSEVVRESVDRR
jgi:HPt (histidine-containing phosphotransfer) domain-containing protein